ncbi:Pyruvate,phosphate dikinase [Enhygromyxa salina]|uniref:Pyruvate, phosphate dikinase n=1 Tax=Enhygromyxa salina TaxID=215803 RepID=A0A0C1Z2R5_9BACT|nr:pyruvate, phosphate dikinase [Enhygromyxa salina]KIG11754.1 Pyruvate,phosphate dikinase [Enhygromyxa salina]
MPRKYVYSFGDGAAEGRDDMKDLLGGKGAALAEMSNAGIPVPPGFTITTHACILHRDLGTVPAEVSRQIDEHLALLEQRMGRKFGDADEPLLVSVRSGAKFSMPGMMDTVLNLGLNPKSVRGLAKSSGDPRFAFDAYRRFIMMYSNVVLGLDRAPFEEVLSAARRKSRKQSDSQLDAKQLEKIIASFEKIVRDQTGKPFPREPHAQLRGAIEAVFGSWDTERAKHYRKLHDISDALGTACSVQAMVFGNRGDRSATGVGFTRNPATGEREFYGEFLQNAQGEDVVAGIRTPLLLEELETILPEAYAELQDITLRLERHYGDMQDFEFTIEEGKLFMLQTRAGKRTGIAAVRVATDMVDEGLITREEAVIRVEPVQLLQLLHPVFDPADRAKYEVAAQGINASPGAACGQLVFTPEDAVTEAEAGNKVVLVRHETSPDDIHGMHAAVGLVTVTGGMTSHAAVVGRQMGKPAVVGCEALRIDTAREQLHINGQTIGRGDWLSIDGTTGEVILAQVATMPSEVVQVVTGKLHPSKSTIFAAFERLLDWADLTRRLRVRANADTGTDAQMALALGAEGIGLARTEHMFFGADRMPKMQQMILARTEAERRKALKKLLPLQRRDFLALFKAMSGLPVTIRTLDPPLHEFLPNPTELKVEIEVLKATSKNKRKGKAERAAELAELEALYERVLSLTEINPMLGWRGCRLTILVPEIIEMQAQALFEAAAKCIATGIPVDPEIMIPLVGDAGELKLQREVVDRVAGEVMRKRGIHINYKIGTMIELPRAALTADAIAAHAEFFSFGTNDLTQTTFGFSRDDAGKFLGHYVDQGILPRNPFVSIDREGVGELMRIAVEKGRTARQGVKIGICGEHGGDPQSVGFCHDLGLDYVSCSPYRIPVARLAAAQAVLHERGVEELRTRARKNLRYKTPPTYHGTARGSTD